MSLYKVLDKIQERFPTHTRDHPLVGPTTTNIGTIQGGVKINIVPDLCNATIDTRYPPGITVDQLKAELNNIIEEEKKSDPRLDIKHTILVDRPPVEINESEPFVQTLLDTIEQVEGKKRECGGVSYFTDASVLSPAGIPLIIYGVGNAGMAHKRDEYLDIEQLETCAKVYTLIALKFSKDF